MDGMVVAPQVPAVEEGIRVLRAGGNAIDAAVTAAFVQMVVDPQQCGVGGFGVAHVRTAGGEHHIIDFNGTAGSRVTPEMWADIAIEQDWTGYGYHIQGQLNDIGYQSIMVPGTVAGMAEILLHYGTWAWHDVLQPAVQLADQGFLISPELWRTWNPPLEDDMFERIQASEASQQLYIRSDGRTYQPGERLRNPDYARVLTRLADAGPRDFYDGELARLMVQDFERNGAFITAGDLASYQVRTPDPLVVTYRGHTVLTNPPAGGGICLCQILNILEEANIADMGLNSPEYIYYVARAMKASYHDWYSLVGDPSFVEIPTDRLLSKEHARNWLGVIKSGEHFSVPRFSEPPTTTHITVIDAAGNAAAITHSLGESSGIVTPGLGFTYNNLMKAAYPVPGHPNSIAPGKSRLTGICPTMVCRDGELIMALGAPGGTRIITAVLQVILNVIDHRLSPLEAVVAPRFDCQGEILDCESRIPSWVKAQLVGKGFEIKPNPAPYGNFGLAQVISCDPTTKELAGGSDPREGGAVMTA